MELEGRIVRSLAGYYTVMAGEEIIECRARGSFRKEGLTPLVGDYARVLRQADGTGTLMELLPRRNALTRPPLANLDQLFLVCSTVEPRPNLRLLDMLIAAAALAGIEPAPVFTKSDLAPGDALAALYRSCGYSARALSPEDGEGVAALRETLRGKVSAFCGNTGVGKSALLNRMAPELRLPTGEISQKLGRGRHTTRHVQMYPVAGGWVADTPGFSALEAEGLAALTRENLAEAFREFAPLLGGCRFQDCSHTKEPGCRIREAVEAGEIPQSRYESYAAMYTELKDRRNCYGKTERGAV